MKVLKFLSIFIFFLSCKKQDENKISSKKEMKKTYSTQELQNLADSLKYDYDGEEEYKSSIEKKIVSIGKPMIPYLLEKLDDTITTKKNIQIHGGFYKVADRAYNYIYDIYYHENWNKYKHLDSLNKYFLKPSEEEIFLKIIPNIKKYKNSNNLELYWVYMYNKENKMSEKERRKRFKEEFVEALNKDLLKP